MTIRLAVLTASAFFCIFTTQAQDVKKLLTPEIGIEGGFPRGTSRSVFDGMVGATLGLMVGTGNSRFTVGTGMLFFASAHQGQRNSSTGFQVPVLFGYKCYFIHQHGFAQVEIGPSQFNQYYSDYKIPTEHSWGPSYAGSIGIRFKPFEFSVKYEALAATGMDIKYIAFGVGYDF